SGSWFSRIELEAVPTVAAGKSHGREVEALRKVDHLEQLAHLVLVEELLRIGTLLKGRACEKLADAAVEKKARLRGVAGDVHAGILAGERDAGEIDVGGDVLFADVDERLRGRP